LEDICSGDAGDIGGAALVVESAVASGYAIESDGDGYATLFSTTADAWRANDDLSVCAWLDLPAVPTEFQDYVTNAVAGNVSTGWSLRTGGSDARNYVFLAVKDGEKFLVQAILDEMALTWKTGGQHVCAVANTTAQEVCYYSDGTFAGCGSNATWDNLLPVAGVSDITTMGRADGNDVVSGVRIACIEVHNSVLGGAGVAAAYERCQP
jgi:hypothetical protein